jgi:polysaccharide biosynthesis/export protein
MSNSKLFTVLLLVAGALSSCKMQEQIAQEKRYFSNTKDSVLYQTINRQPVIQKGDMLSIMVWVRNEVYRREFNSFNGTATMSPSESGTPTATPVGYLVDDDGAIQFPYLGRMIVENKTKKQLAGELQQKLSATFVNDTPLVSIRILNYKITVLGEVNRQGVYSIPGEKVTILEALGLAGDLTYYGKRNNIMIIRESEEGKRETAHMNLNDGNIFDSPYFYLKSNDVVYVEADKKKVASQDQSTLRTISITTGIVSTLAILLTAINNLK